MSNELIRASKTGNLDALLECVKDRPDRDYAFLKACEYGQMNIINKMLDLGVSNIELGLTISFTFRNLTLIKLLIGRPEEFSIYFTFLYACEKGDIEVVEILAGRKDSDINRGLIKGVVNGHINIVKFLRQQGAYFNPIELLHCVHCRYSEVINYLIFTVGYIPYNVKTLNDEQIYYLYKKGIIPSIRFVKRFYVLKTTDKLLEYCLNDIMVPDLIHIITSY